MASILFSFSLTTIAWILPATGILCQMSMKRFILLEIWRHPAQWLLLYVLEISMDSHLLPPCPSP